MSLDTQQQAALEYLRTITTKEETGFEHVYIDPADSYPAKPCLVLEDGDDGMRDERLGGGGDNVYWSLQISGFCARGDLSSAHAACRSMRARLVDVWGRKEHITLGGNCSRCYWEGGVALVSVPGSFETEPEYIGFQGLLTIVFSIERNFPNSD